MPTNGDPDKFNTDAVNPVPEVSAVVNLKLPSFFTEDPALWFAQAEIQFKRRGIVQESTKYEFVAEVLPYSVAQEVRDLIFSPPAEQPYSSLKSSLLDRIAVSKTQRVKNLLSMEELGDRKPSQLLRHMESLLDNSLGLDNLLVSEIFLSRMPSNVRSILAANPLPLTLSQQATLADRIMEASDHQEVAAVSTFNFDSLQAQISKMTADLALLKEEKFRSFRRTGSPDRRSRRDGSAHRSLLDIFGLPKICDSLKQIDFEKEVENRDLKSITMDESGVQDISNTSSSDDSAKNQGIDIDDKIALTTDNNCDTESSRNPRLLKKMSDEKIKDYNYSKAKKMKKEKRPSDKTTKRPNHFVAIKVNNPEIRQKLSGVQQFILDKEPYLKSVIVDVATLHLTLLVIHLANEEEIEKAGDLLRNSFITYQEKFDNEPVLQISGLGHFKNQVLFAKVKRDKNLDLITELAEDIHRRFSEAEMDLSGSKDFNPHLTIAKMSKDPKLFRKGIKKISKQTYDGHTEDFFGSQVITELQLCSMNEPKDEFGYYHVCSQFNFGMSPFN
ncbi:A-kinase anchor protein 7 isoform gamma [Nymphon striatum]|nr:A-kinase anchor protein 7 isoform gamma [Nymphon striatum]